jgi:uncharacterized repeat protein (TIGR03803 family)
MVALMVFPRLSAASSEQDIYYFGPAEGPDGDIGTTLLPGPGGVLYGLDRLSGNLGSTCCGEVFQLNPPATPGGLYTKTVLYQFDANSGTDGNGPIGGLVADKKGVLYGTTEFFANSPTCNGGAVFSLTPPSTRKGGTWTEKVLYNFPGVIDSANQCHFLNGWRPVGNLAIGSDGTLYGVTPWGGSSSACNQTNPEGCGTVFAVKPPTASGGNWTGSTLYSFNGYGAGDGEAPNPVVFSNGALYGTTRLGGAGLNGGTVFALVAPSAAGDVWTESIIHSFDGVSNTDGRSPYAGLTLGAKGILYGTTQLGGTSDAYVGNGLGTIFSMTPPSRGKSSWTETVLFSFGSDGNGDVAQGGYPTSPLALQNGTLYGTTSFGGPDDAGTVFSFALGAPTDTLLYSFQLSDINTGGQSASGVSIGAGGVLYGALNFGPASGAGGAYAVTP